MTTQVLETTDVVKVYRAGVLKKKTVVLNNLSLTFPLQKCTGLFGHNGAGKTTLIRIIFGISKPSKGKITINGEDVSKLDRRKIGYMPEVDKTASLLTPYEILKGHCAIFKVSDTAEKIDTVLTKVGIFASRHKKSRELSKGMGRRLAFAQAVIHEPHFLVLDEPFAGLDPLGRSDMHRWIEEQKTKDATVILCSHELKEAYSLCDEYNIINRGRLVYSTLGTDRKRVDGGDLLTIKVAGVTENDLEELRDSKKLPAWQEIERSATATAISFPAYADAAKWLSRLTTAGFTIASFQPFGQHKSEDELLKFFDQEDQVA